MSFLIHPFVPLEHFQFIQYAERLVSQSLLILCDNHKLGICCSHI
jgi:hypothetical protein